ncbi:MAG: hypothetical protein ABIG61_09465 [Planctomycetota bacterium]
MAKKIEKKQPAAKQTSTVYHIDPDIRSSLSHLIELNKLQSTILQHMKKKLQNCSS